MEKLENKSPLECLQEEIRIFRKNEETTYDILALYGLLLQDSLFCDLAILTLVEKVIHDFENPKVMVPLFAKNVEEFIHFKSAELYRIVRKYQHIDECKETCDAFYGCYKEGIALSIFAQTGLLKANNSFDFITMLLSRDPELVYKLLVSNIPFRIRLAIFKTVINKNSGDLICFLTSVNEKRLAFLTKEEQEKLPQKKQELIDAFYQNGSLRSLIESVINEEKYSRLNRFLDYGMNVNSCYWDCALGPEFLEVETISTVGYLFKKIHNLSVIEKLYADDSYLRIKETARDNNDLLILYYIKLDDILNFIKWPHFVITADKINLIAIRLVERLEPYDSFLLKRGREELKTRVESILMAIIHKAKNKEEYKEMCRYAENLKDLTDIDAVIAKKEKAEQLAIQKQKLREQKRQELTAILQKMNDYALENVPGKRLVKEIDFKENIA